MPSISRKPVNLDVQVLVLVLGLSLTFGATELIRNHDRHATETAFAIAVSDRASAIKRALTQNMRAVRIRTSD